MAHVSGRPTLFAPEALVFALVGPFVLFWPMLLQGGPLLFFDSLAYLERGEAIFGALWQILSPDLDGGAGGSSIREAGAKAESARSIPYSAFVYLTALPAGLFGTVYVQSALILAMLWPFVRNVLAAPTAWLIAAGIILALCTQLPFVASFVMPDGLGAVPILFAILLVRGIDDYRFSSQVAFAAIAAFATLTHYGNIPLALACGCVALAVRAWQRRLDVRVSLLALVPVVLVAMTNAGLGMIAFGETSVAPRRLPVLLARSIADGPARWHLEEHCPAEGYAVCEVFDTIPDTVRDVMWSPDGVKSATPEQMTRIRAEESVILRRAFAEYPLQQTWSLTRNAVRQLGHVGTDDFAIAEVTTAPDGTPRANFDRNHEKYRLLFNAAEVALHATYFGGALLIVGYFVTAAGTGTAPRAAPMCLVLLTGILANAVVFGGLSAPVDRYQARVAWLVPLFAALFWLEAATVPSRRWPAGSKHAQ